MNRISRTLGLGALGLTLVGCAGQNIHPVACMIGGALVGGAAGYYGTDHDDGAAAASAAGGALLGAIFCKEEEPKPAAPAPKPAPKPQPKPEPIPDPDSDGDGVVDRLDKCPGTPKGTPVDEHGCPEIPNLTGVHFEHDQATLTAEAKAELGIAVGILQNNPHVRVEVVGHTDSSGSAEYNQKLSQLRAESVSNFFQSQGIAADRIGADGKGESTPVADNETKAGRAKNRRVELTARQLK